MADADRGHLRVTKAVEQRVGMNKETETTLAQRELTPAQLREFKAAFNLFDKNHDGTIDVNEMATVMRSLGQVVSQNEIVEMIAQGDGDGDGSIDFDEFVIMMAAKLRTMDSEEEMKEAFKFFDKKGTGFITFDKLKSVMVTIGENCSDAELKEMIMEADMDKDGQVDYEEFLKMVGPENDSAYIAQDAARKMAKPGAAGRQ